MVSYEREQMFVVVVVEEALLENVDCFAFSFVGGAEVAFALWFAWIYCACFGVKMSCDDASLVLAGDLCLLLFACIFLFAHTIDCLCNFFWFSVQVCDSWFYRL